MSKSRPRGYQGLSSGSRRGFWTSDLTRKRPLERGPLGSDRRLFRRRFGRRRLSRLASSGGALVSLEVVIAGVFNALLQVTVRRTTAARLLVILAVRKFEVL